MAAFQTKHFGQITYGTDSELDFPAGLPGFEERRRFVAVRFVESDPLIYLQSLEDPGLCFITMPILVAEPHYRMKVSDEDLGHLELPAGRQPQIGQDVLCLTIVSVQETGATANLLAPVLVNLRNRRAVQAVAQDSDYSVQCPLVQQEAAACC